MKIPFLFLSLFMSTLAVGQKSTRDTNYVFWSKDRRLQPADFEIKVAHIASSYSFAQFSIDYTVMGAFTFGLPKDYKKKIRNYFIKSASWLDTTYEVMTSIRYQQTLFDLAEIYVRHFRKAVHDNRKKIISGKIKLDALNSQEVTEFSNRRVQYDTTTNFGTIADKQQAWESLIGKELEEFKEFSAE